MIPSDDEVRALHRKHAPTDQAFELVYTHCQIVCAVAEQLMPGNVDAGLVRAGALLHDIGVYRLYDAAGALDGGNYIRHGILGHAILREEGLPERLCRFCSCHTGVGLTHDDVIRQGLPLPPADYVAETDEEDLVMYADKFHSKTTPPTFLTADTYAAKVSRFGEDKADRFLALRKKFGEPDLASLAAAHGHSIL